MMGRKSNKQSKGRGRPKKVSRRSINSGRKRSNLKNVSRTTLNNRAQDLLNDPNYKYFRSNTINHCRQSSREYRTKDLYTRAIEMSDPTISLINIEKRIAILRKHRISAQVENYIQDK